MINNYYFLSVNATYNQNAILKNDVFKDSETNMDKWINSDTDGLLKPALQKPS